MSTKITENCIDCDKEIIMKGKLIVNGSLLKYKHNDKEIWVYKCKECFEKSPELRNFQECEVYSRVVGYLRPVQQWHTGKKQEFSDRKDYLLNKKSASKKT